MEICTHAQAVNAGMRQMALVGHKPYVILGTRVDGKVWLASEHANEKAAKRALTKWLARYPAKADQSRLAAADTDALPFHVSSTGMLHVQGCGNRHGRGIGRVTVVSAEEAATIAKRCEHCRPTPLGTVVEQGDRKAILAAARAAEAEARQAAAQAADALWAAMQSPELDELLRTFRAAAATAGDVLSGPAFEAARAAYRAMDNAAPEGWSFFRRAKELGL